MKPISACLFLLYAALLLSACASFAVKDTQDGIIVAKATLTGVNNSIASLVANKQISVEKAKAFAADADNAESQIKTAEALLGQGRPADAADVLRLANQLLLRLQLEMEKRQ